MRLYETVALIQIQKLERPTMTHFESGYGDPFGGTRGIRNIADFIAISETKGHRRTRIDTQY